MTVDLIIRTLATIIIAYLLGSLNPAIMITKLKTGKDIRTMGSGNAGFTNVLRSVGKGPPSRRSFLTISRASPPC